jgi:hypothetical protein
MPTFMQGSPWLFVPIIASLLLMVVWLTRIRFIRRIDADSIADTEIDPHFPPEKS